MTEIYEATTATITVVFRDENGDAIIPTSGSFVLYDKFSGTVKRTGSLENLEASMDFELTEDDSSIIDQINKYEILRLEVEFNYNSKVGRGLYEVKIVNLSYFIPA
jgi:hypothetical protein